MTKKQDKESVKGHLHSINSEDKAKSYNQLFCFYFFSSVKNFYTRAALEGTDLGHLGEAFSFPYGDFL